MYKVTYFPTASESTVFFKWFKTLKEATDFAMKLGSDVLEIKKYDEPEKYHYHGS